MDFRERVQETLNKGLKSSRELFDRARDKAKDLGEKSVIRIELTQLDSQVEKLFAKLGAAVYKRLIDEQHQTVSALSPEVKELLAELADVRARIEEKERQLKDFA